MRTTHLAPAATVASRLWPCSAQNMLLRTVTLVLLGNMVLALSAHVQVPFWPVKLSMQTFVVLAIGVAYGSRLAGATVLAYLIEGGFGLPVFQGGAGLVYMAGPTGGYLLGFLLAATAVGALAERGSLNRLPTALGVILIGEALIYAPGIAWLAVLYGPENSMAYGFTPFVTGEILKIGLVLGLVPVIRRVAMNG